MINLSLHHHSKSHLRLTSKDLSNMRVLFSSSGYDRWSRESLPSTAWLVAFDTAIENISILNISKEWKHTRTCEHVRTHEHINDQQTEAIYSSVQAVAYESKHWTYA